jgi:heme exporter protein C
MNWEWFHRLGSFPHFYKFCVRWSPWFGAVGLVLLLIGSVWGLAFAPSDYQQGDSFRIIYLHVPSAFLSMSLYVAMAVAAAIGFIWRMKMAHMAVQVIPTVGAAMTFLALFSGAFWGKPMWGTYWVWDARLTSELVLLFLYLGVIALDSAIDERQAAAKACGILAIVGVINIPIIHYSVQWWNTLHQGATISKFDKPSMDLDMLWPRLINILAFGFVCGYFILERFKNAILFWERRSRWVAEMVEEKA